MLFIFFYETILAVNTHSTLRTDCYVSFSNPALYIKISHYFPSGPLHLIASLSAYRESSIQDRILEDASDYFHFKLFDDKCTPSPLFSTLGTDLKKLRISILLYLHLPGDIFAHFNYNFCKGFKPGFYELFDKYQNFLLHTQIQDIEENYFKGLEGLYEIAYSYRNSINGKNMEICIITENNRGAILKPNYSDNSPYGFITLLRADLFKNGGEIGLVTYPAFECNKSETYSEDALIFIIDENDKRVSFSVIDAHNNQKKFKLPHPKLFSVNNLKSIPEGYKKLFLMIPLIDYIFHDRSNGVCYYSNYNIIYYAKVFQKIYISPWVEFSCEFSRSPYDLC